ncbi:MAG: ABC transporter ATP-binding protein [Pirellulaceae bacterium]
MTGKSQNQPLPLRELFAQLWELLTQQDRMRAGGVLLFLLVGTVLEILGVGMIIPVVALLSQPDVANSSAAMQSLHATLGSPSHQDFIFWVLGGLLAAFVIKNVFLFLSIHWQTRFLVNFQSKLAGELVTGYLNRPYTYHLHHPTAELLQKINGELPVFIQSVLSPVIWIISEGLVVVGLLLLALWVNPLGAIIVVGGLSVAILVYYHLFKVRVEFWGRQTQQHAQGMYREMQHSLGGIKEVKVFGREQYFSAAFGRHAEGFARSLGKHNFLSQSSRQVIELLVISVLLGAIMLLVGRDGAMTNILPTLAFFAAAAFRLMPSAQRLLSNAHNVRFGARTLRLLRPDLLHARAYDKPQPERPDTMAFCRELTLRKVTFRYHGGHEDVLHDIDLAIPQGTMVGFQGESGAGKTTLVDLVLGLLEPTKGEVVVDGNSIQRDLPGWQANIGYVPQSIFLMDDTLCRNVAFGLKEKDINLDRVNEVLRQAQLLEFVKSRPDGIETMVGERGVRLSGGQRQRIGIARALYHDPEILILDEATASLDLETEAEFIKAIESLKNKKTILIISHRLSTMAGCDRKYQLIAGQLCPLTSQSVEG